jgi:hypothetical protein
MGKTTESDKLLMPLSHIVGDTPYATLAFKYVGVWQVEIFPGLSRNLTTCSGVQLGNDCKCDMYQVDSGHHTIRLDNFWVDL